MKSPRPWWGLLILATALVVATRSLLPTAARHEPLTARDSPIRSSKTTDGIALSTPLVTKAAEKKIEADWNDLLDWLEREPRPGADEIKQRLLALREAWAEMDPIVLAEAIARLLESRRDAPTGMAFQVGLHGFLDGWPTLRIFLLDALVAADPDTAAATARRLLEKTTSPDEYAVALRSLTRNGFSRAPDTELQEHFRVLLGKPEWQASGGFAESLDLARSVGTEAIADDLMHWNGNPELKSMALHEFAAEHPKTLLEPLRSEIEIPPSLRATLMARMDPQFPDQVVAVDEYLRDPAITNDEAAVFLKAFPLRSATTGPRLYGRSPAPYDMDQIAAGDRAAIKLVDGWLVDPTLQTIRPELLALQKRLGEWVEQTK